MATHKSAIKRDRQNKKRREQNRSSRSSVRSAVKAAKAAKAANDSAAPELLRKAESLMAKAVRKGLYHPKTASRSISRLAKKAAK